MRITLPNIFYGVSHPLRAIRYVRHRDNIPYNQIAAYLPSNPVILEAGAHNGSDSVEIAGFWPEGILHAFEPVPSAFELLTSEAKRFDGRIACYQSALGPKKDRMTMHLSGDGSAGSCQSSSLLQPAAGHEAEYSFITFEKLIEIEVTTIDDWAVENNITHVDFLRLDMQGYELEALKGGRRTLESTVAIQLEVSNIQLYKNAPLYPEVRDWMDRAGFRPRIEAVFRVGGNVLFTKK